MSEDHSNKSVVICDTQPITAEGLRSLLGSAGGLEFLASLNSLDAATQLASARTPDIVVVDKGFGMRAVLDWIHDFKLTDATAAVTVWGVSMTEAEALGLHQAGARGIVRKTAELASILSCLRTVASGRSWMEDCVFRDSVRRYPRSELTPREQQLLLFHPAILPVVKRNFSLCGRRNFSLCCDREPTPTEDGLRSGRAS